MDNKNFDSQKKLCLSKLDLSRKGSVDPPIANLIHNINASEHYFTTSSCSGRLLLYSPSTSAGKRGCRWFWVLHEPPCRDDPSRFAEVFLEQCYSDREARPDTGESMDGEHCNNSALNPLIVEHRPFSAPSELDSKATGQTTDEKNPVEFCGNLEAFTSGCETPVGVTQDTKGGSSHDFISVSTGVSATNEVIYLKFEPVILHVSCRSLKSAQLLHTKVLVAGFRNSGLTLGNKGKIVLAIRCTLNLEIPIAFRNNTIAVSKEYLGEILGVINEKFRLNANMIEKLELIFQVENGG